MVPRKHSVIISIVIVTILITGIVTISNGGTSTTKITITSRTTSHRTTLGYLNSFTTTTKTVRTTTTTRQIATTSTSIATTSKSTSRQQTYVTSSPPQSSQWLVVQYSVLPSVVQASDSGVIPRFSSLASLNQTVIGSVCISIQNNQCVSWNTLAQTGWFFDPVNLILYIHYVGGASIQIIVKQ